MQGMIPMRKYRELVAGLIVGATLGLILVPLALRVDYLAEVVFLVSALGLALLALAKVAGRL